MIRIMREMKITEIYVYKTTLISYKSRITPIPNKHSPNNFILKSKNFNIKANKPLSYQRNPTSR